MKGLNIINDFLGIFKDWPWVTGPSLTLWLTLILVIFMVYFLLLLIRQTTTDKEKKLNLAEVPEVPEGVNAIERSKKSLWARFITPIGICIRPISVFISNDRCL